jgi:hypothetical protein
MNDKQIAALARRNAAKAAAANGSGARKQYDATLPATRPADADDRASSESQRLFQEMKRREF